MTQLHFAKRYRSLLVLMVWMAIIGACGPMQKSSETPAITAPAAISTPGIKGVVYQSGPTLWLLNPEGKTKERLLEPVNFAASVSNNLSQIAYSTNSQDLWIVTRGENEAQQVRFEQLSRLDLSINRLAWAPQDDKLAVLAVPQNDPRSVPEKARIFIIDRDHADVKQIGCGIDFAWNATGDQLLVNKMFCADGEGIYLVVLENLSSRPLFREQTDVEAMTTSPVEEKVAFIAGKIFEQSVYIGELSSGVSTQLLDEDIENKYQSLDELAWSPDGQELAILATAVRGDNMARPNLIIINLATQEFREIASSIRGPIIWSPSSDAIATTVFTNTTGIYQVNTISGEVELLIDDRLATPTNFIWK